MAKDDTEILEVFTRINTLLAENRDNTLEIKALLLKQGEGIGKALMSAMEEKFSGRSSEARTRYIESMSARVPAPDDKTLYCSFCGKTQQEVKRLVAGPSVFICDECTELCMSIVQSAAQKADTGGPGGEGGKS